VPPGTVRRLPTRPGAGTAREDGARQRRQTVRELHDAAAAGRRGAARGWREAVQGGLIGGRQAGRRGGGWQRPVQGWPKAAAWRGYDASRWRPPA
jgi:hypothetical protein